MSHIIKTSTKRVIILAIRKLIISFVVSFLDLFLLLKTHILFVTKAKITAMIQAIMVAGMVSTAVNLERAQKEIRLIKVVSTPKNK